MAAVQTSGTRARISARLDRRAGGLKRNVEPFRQGELDSLCGLYAVLNALNALCAEVDNDVGEALFGVMVQALSQAADRPLAALSCGMSQDLVVAMLDVACRELERLLDIRIRHRAFPAFDEPPKLGILWDRLQGEISRSQVAIVGISGVHEHWTVAYAVSPKVIRLADSQDWRVLMRDRCTTRPSKQRVRLDPAAIILVRRKR